MVISNTGKAFSYPKNNYYSNRLKRYEIDHQFFRYDKINTPSACLYFKKIFYKEFIPYMKEKELYNDIQLRRALSLWQNKFNRYRKIPGFRNYGKSPVEIVLSNA